MARLTGMKEICDYERKSDATVLMMIREKGYPAKKITGHIWESDTDLIDAWWKRVLSEDQQESEISVPAAASRRKGRRAPAKKRF